MPQRLRDHVESLSQRQEEAEHIKYEAALTLKYKKNFPTIEPITRDEIITLTARVAKMKDKLIADVRSVRAHLPKDQ